jgi:hypothetical protein
MGIENQLKRRKPGFCRAFVISISVSILGNWVELLCHFGKEYLGAVNDCSYVGYDFGVCENRDLGA